jgi:DNA-binding transcriptional ArsR family regulator
VSQSLQGFKAELFKALGHPMRIRILELLHDGERSVGDLQTALAAEGSTVSQQLAVLRLKNLVDTRRVGTLIYYRIRDPQVSELLRVARLIFEAHVIQLRSMAEESDVDDSRQRVAGAG